MLLEKTEVFYKKAAIVVSRLIPEYLISDKKLAQKVDKLCREKDYDSSKYVCNCMSTYRSVEIMEKRIMGTPTEYQFENITVYGPELYDEYLTHIYGDWRKLPPKEKQISNHDFVMLDLEKLYLEK